MTANPRLSDMKVIEVGQLSGGPETLLADYLSEKAAEFTYIEVLNSRYYQPRISLVRVSHYVKGTLKDTIEKGSNLEIILRFKPLRLPIMYFVCLLWILRYSVKFSGKPDLYIGCNLPFPLAGFILRWFGRVKKLIYVSEDHPQQSHSFTPDSLLRNFLRFIDRWAYNASNVVWFQSNNMIKAKQDEGIIRNTVVPRLLVPIGVNLEKARQVDQKKVNRHSIGYVGEVTARMGLGLAVESLAAVRETVPDVRLVIIGSGPDVENLKNKAADLGILENLEFAGFINNKDDIRAILSACSISLALYAPEPDNPIWFADPAKVKEYIEYGTPVLVSRVPEIAEEIQREHAGFAVEYTKEKITEAMLKLLIDDELWRECRKNVRKLAEKYDYRKLYDEAFRQSGIGLV